MQKKLKLSQKCILRLKNKDIFLIFKEYFIFFKEMLW